MTSNEYKAYQAAVAAFMEREKLENLTSTAIGEPFCSSRACDCCGDHFQGNRENANGYSRIDDEVKEYEICENCVYYAEYGRLDDMTMMEVEGDNHGH